MASSSAPASSDMQDHNAHVVATQQQRNVHNSAAFLLPHLAPHFHLLDIGCREGIITVGFADLLHRGHVTGVDPQPEFIDRARHLLSTRERPSANLTFETGNMLEGLKYADASFDVVYAYERLIHTTDPVRAVAEMRRVLKPGGILACYDTVHAHWWPPSPGLELLITAMKKMFSGAGVPGLLCGAVHQFVRRGGFEAEKMVVGAGAMVFQSKEERRWFAAMHIGRFMKEGIGKKYAEMGAMDEQGTEVVCRALQDWAAAEDAWYVGTQAKILAWK